MGRVGKIRPQQIKTAQRIISELPEKNDSCTREEAAELLANDFKRAFKKGYTPKEICALFKNHGIVMAEYLVARYQISEEEDSPDAPQPRPRKKNGLETSQQGQAPENKSQAVQNTRQINADAPRTQVKDAGTGSANVADSQSVLPGKFAIIPDTPIGEL